MSDGGAAGKLVWLYEDGGWKLITDPISWDSAGDDALAKLAEAGYTEEPATRDAASFLVVGLNGKEAKPAVEFSLFVRQDSPQCLIEIEGPGGSIRTVYTARFPDGLDLLARSAPLAQAGVLTALAGDLVQLSSDQRGRPHTPPGGLVESVVRRAYGVLP